MSDGIPGYASFPRYANAERLVAETTRAMEAGFTAVKLHEIDPEMAAALRAEFGAIAALRSACAMTLSPSIAPGTRAREHL